LRSARPRVCLPQVGPGPRTAHSYFYCVGFPQSRHSWRELPTTIGRPGFRAVAPDQRGRSDDAIGSGARRQQERVGEILGRLLYLVRRIRPCSPSALATQIKTMIECEATTKELDPTLSMLDLVGN
jgi:hypothetical protein